MSFFVRCDDGSMVNLDHAWSLFIANVFDDETLYAVVAVGGFAELTKEIKSFEDRDNAEAFLNQIAARANGAAPEPISGLDQFTVSRGLRFGSPSKRTAR